MLGKTKELIPQNRLKLPAGGADTNLQTTGDRNVSNSQIRHRIDVVLVIFPKNQRTKFHNRLVAEDEGSAVQY
ncbi:hypothetical protein NIES3585_13190 [Nodularia sp. NIES-3585]|nr:hypothetical protein NIES3585_13190 [Nodularia sp. NIES-3585]